jgi:hypothetical protein
MKTFIRPAIIALALIGTISAASAAPKHHAPHEQTGLAQQLDFWAQFND